MKAKVIPVRPKSPAPVRRPRRSKEQTGQERLLYESSYVHLEDQIAITPEEKLHLVQNGIRRRNRVGRTLFGEWEPRRLTFREGREKVLVSFFSRHPEWPPSLLLNLMQACDSQMANNLYHPKRWEADFPLGRGMDAVYVATNLAKVTSALGWTLSDLSLAASVPPADQGPPGGPCEGSSAVKRTYLMKRRVWQPHYDPRDILDEDFRRIALLAQRAKVNPHRFVEAQFLQFFQESNGYAAPSPSYLYRVSAEMCAVNAAHLQPHNEGELCFANEVRILNEQIDMYPGKTLDEILQETWGVFKPFTKLVFCSEAALADIQAKWGRAAGRFVKRWPALEDDLRKNYITRFNRLGIP